jgi:hypothetical protein
MTEHVKLASLQVTPAELQGIAYAVANVGWKMADFEVIKTLVAKIELAAHSLKEEGKADVGQK